MHPVLYLSLIFITSVIAGSIGAILGLGGGILLVPLLTAVFGIDLRFAAGASLISVITTSSGAAAAYLRTRLSNIRIGLFLVMATTGGALAGARLVGVIPPRGLELILGLALIYSIYAMRRHLDVELPGDDQPADALASAFRLQGTYYDVTLARDVPYRATRTVHAFIAMFGAGLLSGLLGIGSGVFKVLAMDSFMRLPMKVSTATSNFMIGITAAASAGVYFARGDIHPVLAVPVALGVMIGARTGTHMMASMRNVTVRKAFIPVLALLAASMIYKALW